MFSNKYGIMKRTVIIVKYYNYIGAVDAELSLYMLSLGCSVQLYEQFTCQKACTDYIIYFVITHKRHLIWVRASLTHPEE